MKYIFIKEKKLKCTLYYLVRKKDLFEYFNFNLIFVVVPFFKTFNGTNFILNL